MAMASEISAPDLLIEEGLQDESLRESIEVEFATDVEAPGKRCRHCGDRYSEWLPIAYVGAHVSGGIRECCCTFAFYEQ